MVFSALLVANVEQNDLFGLKPGIDGSKLDDGTQQQPCAADQQQRQGQLRDHQHSRQPLAAAGSGRASRAGDGRVQASPGQPQSGKRARE